MGHLALGGGLLFLAACRSTDSKPTLFDVDSFGLEFGDDIELRLLWEQQRALSFDRASDREAWLGLYDKAVALELDAPKWAAPGRLVDELDRERLNGPAAWARRRAQANGAGASSQAHGNYLLGRLETASLASDLFQRSTELEPGFAFGWHSVAWEASRGEGGLSAASRFENMAAGRAGGVHEALVIGLAAARYLEARDLSPQAWDVYGQLADLPGLTVAEAARVRALDLRSRLLHPELVLSGKLLNGRLMQESMVARPKGGEAARRKILMDALGLLEADSGLVDSDLSGLIAAVLEADLDRPASQLRGLIVGALGQRGGLRAVALREDLLWRNQASALGLVLAPGPSGMGGLGPDQRAAAMALVRGDGQAWLGAWQAGLPSRVRANLTVGALGQEHGGTVPELAQDLISAGWFDAARMLLLHSETGADGLRQEALAGKVFVEELARLLHTRTGSEQGAGLAGLLAEVAELEQRLGTGDGESILTSEVEEHGPFAGLIRVARMSSSGEPPAGFAALMQRLGRVAVVGHQSGILDGTMRSVVGIEDLDGEHLGAPFTGTGFWCQGVDVLSRAERAGVGISGAAVHAGFWIDVEAVRAEVLGDRAFAQRHMDAAGEQGFDFGLAPECPTGDFERRVPLLGEGRRLQLVLAQELGPMSLDQRIAMVAIHEEAHLCDRARFLPIGENWKAALGFLARMGFSPDRIMGQLEYRAQLVAICEAAEPRYALAEVLNLAEANEALVGDAVTPHGDGYRRLLNDLGSLGGGGFDPGRYQRWQWHRIDGETLRGLAMQLARTEGLVAE